MPKRWPAKVHMKSQRQAELLVPSVQPLKAKQPVGPGDQGPTQVTPNCLGPEVWGVTMRR